MTHLRQLSYVYIALLPFVAAADLAANDLPDDAVWYMHADLKLMRSVDSGREIYAWFEDEVVSEVKAEVGIDLSKEVDRITAFSDADKGAIVVIDGAISEQLQEKLLAVAVLKGSVDEREYRDKPYFAFEDSGMTRGDDLDHGFFTFDVQGKVIAATDEDRLKALLDTSGQIPTAGSYEGALVVLTADREFVKAGMRTGEISGTADDKDWNSRILRNTEQAAVLVSDQSGQLAVEAKLVSKDAAMATSIGNIISGLISLQAFNDELDPAIVALLQSTEVDVTEKILSVSALIEPAALLDILED